MLGKRTLTRRTLAAGRWPGSPSWAQGAGSALGRWAARLSEVGRYEPVSLTFPLPPLLAPATESIQSVAGAKGSPDYSGPRHSISHLPLSVNCPNLAY